MPAEEFRDGFVNRLRSYVTALFEWLEKNRNIEDGTGEPSFSQRFEGLIQEAQQRGMSKANLDFLRDLQEASEEEEKDEQLSTP